METVCEPKSKKAKDCVPKLLDGKYFKIVKSNNTRVEAECTTCNKIRKGDLKSTGNFMQHIRKSHFEIANEADLYRKSGIDEKYEAFQKKQKAIDDLMKKCSKEDVSLEMVLRNLIISFQNNHPNFTCFDSSSSPA